MAIESKNLLVWVKAMSRGQALPLDASEVYESYDAAEAYAASATSYAGQTIKAKLEDGKYHSYTLQPSDAGYVLEEVGAISASDLKQYVQIVSGDKLPESGQKQGVLYIHGTDGYIWVDDDWKKVFWDLTDELNEKAPINNPEFTGTVKVGGEEVALKSYVEGLFANLEESTVPGIVDSSNPIPDNYQAGRSYRVAEAGTYCGVDCEVGDLILVVKDYSEDTASDADFMVLQSNIDGAVTSTADTATIGEIVVFDAVTGKVIKGSGISITSLNEAIANASHANRAQLDTYDKTQAELLAAAKEEAQGLVDELAETVGDKANSADVYTKGAIDSFLKTMQDNVNTKISASELNEKIGNIGDHETVVAYVDAQVAAHDVQVEGRIGDIPEDTTIKSYIDSAVGSGGTASATAIATAKQEAIDASKAYTNAQLAVVEF